MKKHKTKKLKTPLWQQIVYLLLVAGGPAVTIYVAAIIDNPKSYYISYFTFFLLGLITLILLNSFVIKPWKIKLQAQIATLELNYQTKVGPPIETKKMWNSLNFKIFLWNGGITLFVAFGIYFLLTSIVKWTLDIRVYLLIMFTSVFFGLIFRAFCYLGNPFKKIEEDDTTT